MLRRDHDFAIGHAQATDALRAMDILGLQARDRVRTALRIVCCTTPAQVAAFDAAFDRYFTQAWHGVAQPDYVPRHSRTDDAAVPPPETQPADTDRRPAAPDEVAPDGAVTRARERRPTGDDSDEPPSTGSRRARYSPAAASSDAFPDELDTGAAYSLAAARTIAAVRLGRSRRRRPLPNGTAFDLRATLRASLQHGGEPLALRYRGHPLRNPRFVVLVDGSRSVADRTHAIVAFARALAGRSLRTSVFTFSTELREITRALRGPRAQTTFDFGRAWGGGTRIGENLTRFVADHGARLLTPETLVFIFSDGFDMGDAPQLARAMRELERRSAGIVWLNPHAATPGFAPTARGMRTALPYLLMLESAQDAADFTRLAQRIAHHPRIRGRR